MKANDTDPKRIGARKEPQRLNAHPEPNLIEGHPAPECLPPHDESIPAAAAGASAAATDGPTYTSDAQEARGVFGNAARVALGILAALVVCAILFWKPGVPDTRHLATAVQQEAESTEAIYAVPQYTAVAVPATDEAYTTAGSGRVGASTVVVYLFNTDKSSIPETSALTALAEAANRTGKTVMIKAYTDETGPAAYNQRLSERRAKAVGDYMADHGVAASKIKAKGYGPTHAFADMAHDRRAEVSLR